MFKASVRLSGNTLKLIAAAAMLLDHVGLMFFPRSAVFRILGRLALPIFGYMIAEGCKYTRSRKRYFFTIFSLAAVCQGVYFLVDGSMYLSILCTFSLSIGVIYALQAAKARGGGMWLLPAAAVAGVWLLNRVLTVDYGFWGCMLPVFPALLHHTGYDRQPYSTALLGIGLVFLALASGGVQWWALLALPLVLLYSGQRGAWRMKYFFYVFYPAHLAILQLIAWLAGV